MSDRCRFTPAEHRKQQPHIDSVSGTFYGIYTAQQTQRGNRLNGVSPFKDITSISFMETNSRSQVSLVSALGFLEPEPVIEGLNRSFASPSLSRMQGPGCQLLGFVGEGAVGTG